jgi:hypothetical protein
MSGSTAVPDRLGEVARRQEQARATRDGAFRFEYFLRPKARVFGIAYIQPKKDALKVAVIRKSAVARRDRPNSTASRCVFIRCAVEISFLARSNALPSQR